MSARQARPVWMFGAPPTDVLFGISWIGSRSSFARTTAPHRAGPSSRRGEGLPFPPTDFRQGSASACERRSRAGAGLFDFTTRRLRAGRDGSARASAGEWRCPSDRDPKWSVVEGQKKPISANIQDSVEESGDDAASEPYTQKSEGGTSGSPATTPWATALVADPRRTRKESEP